MRLQLALEVPFFKKKEKKLNFLYVLGALSIRLISLKKAAELLELDVDGLLQLLDSIGFNYSYLEREDIKIEKEWKR